MKSRKLTYAGIFITLGIVLPMAFHWVGLGKVFLPMHIPILLAAFLVGPLTAATVGFITPLLSSVLTGMPPLSPPTALMMAIELPLYGLLAGFAYHRWSFGKVSALLVAILAGRLVYGVLMWLALPIVGLESIHPLYPIGAGLVSSLPGVLIQIIVIPAAIALLEKHTTSAIPKES